MEENSFPKFPYSEETSDHAYHMRTTVAAVETWLYEIISECSSFISIPQDCVLHFDDVYTFFFLLSQLLTLYKAQIHLCLKDGLLL